MKNILILATFITCFVSLHAQETNGLLFDGTDNQVILSGTENIDFGTAEFTIEMVIKAQFSQQDFPNLISNREIVDQGFLLGIYGAYDGSGRLYTQIDGVNMPINTGGINLMDNTCHHIALTRSADSLRYYVDGVQIYARVNNSGSVDTNHAFWVGNDEPTTTTAFNGTIKEIRFWNIVRSEFEINSYQSTQLLGNESGLEGYWRFDESNGQDVADVSTNGNDGTLGFDFAIEGADPIWTGDCGIAYNTTGIETITQNERTIVGIYDLMGRKTTITANTLLIFLYDDGSIEKVFQFMEH